MDTIVIVSVLDPETLN